MANDEETIIVKRGDLRTLLIELQNGVASDQDRSTPLAPRRGATGEDARIISDAVRTEMDRAKTDFMRDVKDAIREATKDFLSETKITKTIEDTFEDIGLPIDKDSRRETAEAVRGMIKWQRLVDRGLKAMAFTLIMAVLAALAKLVGFNLSMPSGAK